MKNKTQTMDLPNGGTMVIAVDDSIVQGNITITEA